jgi:hypothetical protein
VQVLGSLVRPETNGPSCALHDDVGAQAAEHACFELFRGVEIVDGDVLCLGQLGTAYRASVASLVILSYEAESLDAFDAEYVTGVVNDQYLCVSHGLRGANLQVVTSARSVSSFLHLRLLQVSVFSMGG